MTAHYEYPPPTPIPDPNEKRGFATAGFVCGLIGLFLGWIIWPLPILGIVFGAIGWRHGLGKAGVILGILSIVSGIIIFIAVFASSSNTTTINGSATRPDAAATAAVVVPLPAQVAQ